MASLSSKLRFLSPKNPNPLLQTLIFHQPPFLLVPLLPLSLLPNLLPISLVTIPNLIISQTHQIPNPIPSQSQPKSQIDPSNLPPKLSEIVTLFQSVPDPKSRYQQLLYYGTQLPRYPAEFRSDAYRVRGCVSQVWVRAFPDPNDPSKVRFEADSDSSLTKGLAALLVLGLSGEPPSVVVNVSPEFVQLLGLKQSLTPSRNNGFLNMLKLMQEKAAEVGGLGVGDQDGALMEEGGGLGRNNGGFEKNLESAEVSGGADEEIENSSEGSGGVVVVEDSRANGGLIGGRSERMRERLEKELSPVELEIEDVSHMHAGHAGVRGNASGETHFNLRVVSKEFEGKSMVKRHRLVYDLLREELDSGLHALSIVAKAPSEV